MHNKIFKKEEKDIGGVNSKGSKLCSDYNLYTNNKETKIVEEDEMIDFTSDKKMLNNNKLSFIDSRNSIF
jgi:hypothetical protein